MIATEFEIARALAINFHNGQMYGHQPYIYHLDAVVASVVSSNTNEDRFLIVAILHDVLEDTDCTEGVLSFYFGSRITKAVVALTKIEGEAYEDYIARVKKNPLALIVKMHDTMCNLKESLCQQNMNRVKKYSKQMSLLAEK